MFGNIDMLKLKGYPSSYHLFYFSFYFLFSYFLFYFILFISFIFLDKVLGKYVENWTAKNKK